MTPLLWGIVIAGALAVITFVGSLIVGLTKGFREPLARRLLTTAASLGIVCAVLGMVLSFTGG
ncbi:hypothetical protein [Parenemella sanctibonifatiensis]|uniref:Uncharacterized protein n=1 Tax=Parenemella sanctibonifatiensis TaxID=2016505 RepID=A0A255E9Q9_9ACTN|nr:hypothetical protein [Parenemella sanctibonifatiensis]OYN87651.1 hypothetical protein CGZ92_08115 [Parenemella sanctibonifatiensis]OYN89140.1 hypothetical protein CGZ91_12850 [Parenemella sanctibonifatiensis]